MEHVAIVVYKDAEFYNRRPPAVFPTEYRATLRLDDADFEQLRQAVDARGMISVSRVRDTDALRDVHVGALIDKINRAMIEDRFARRPADRLGNGVFGIRIDLQEEAGVNG